MNRRTLGVIAAAFIAQGLAIGATIGAFSLFVRPVAEAFDASTLQVSAGISLITLTLALCGVPVGNWLDRGTPRYVMLTGCGIIATAIALASQATSLGALGLLCVMAGAGIPMLGPLTTAAVVGKVAEAQRGRALGIANLGIPVFALGFALLAGFAIEAWGWRGTLQCFAGVIVTLGVPAILLGIPQQLGAEARAREEASAAHAWTPKQLLASTRFRFMALILGIGMGTNAGWVAHVAPYLSDLGASTRYAGAALGSMQGAMVLGTLSLGAMADRFSAVRILLAVFAVQLGCFGVLLADLGLAPATAALLLSGVVSGGFLPLFGHLFAENFGTANLGRAMGLANLAMLPFGFGLPMIAGALRDASGDYSTTLVLCGVLLSVGLGAITRLSRDRETGAPAPP